MARVDPNQGLVPSILDRLVDPATAGIEGRPGYTLRQMMDSVREDLEDLLNTRQTLGLLGKNRERLRHSIFGYGLPDLTSMQAVTPQQRAEIARILERTVARHEPRLRDVHVVLVDAEDTTHPKLRFRIEARLMLEPAPEVAFETIVEMATGRHTVQHTAQPE